MAALPIWTLTNSIVAGNDATGNSDIVNFGVLTTNGTNLFSQPGAGDGGDIAGADITNIFRDTGNSSLFTGAEGGRLGDNGGPTFDRRDQAAGLGQNAPGTGCLATSPTPTATVSSARPCRSMRAALRATSAASTSARSSCSRARPTRSPRSTTRNSTAAILPPSRRTAVASRCARRWRSPMRIPDLARHDRVPRRSGQRNAENLARRADGPRRHGDRRRYDRRHRRRRRHADHDRCGRRLAHLPHHLRHIDPERPGDERRRSDRRLRALERLWRRGRHRRVSLQFRRGCPRHHLPIRRSRTAMRSTAAASRSMSAARCPWRTPP